MSHIKLHSNSVVKIDFIYYLEALINPLDQILNVVYGNDDNRYKFTDDFIDKQLDFGYKIRTKVIEEITNAKQTTFGIYRLNNLFFKLYKV